eukprot:gene20143-22116_t
MDDRKEQKLSEFVKTAMNNGVSCTGDDNSDLKFCKDAGVLTKLDAGAQLKKPEDEISNQAPGGSCIKQSQIHCNRGLNEEERNEQFDVRDTSQKCRENGIKSEIPSTSKISNFNSENNKEETDNLEQKCALASKATNDISDTLSTLSIKENDNDKQIDFIPYKTEEQLPDLIDLITKDLSEPYSIYTYRYFLHNWPHLSHLAYCGSECVGAIVCKLDVHRKSVLRGYIAMLVVHKGYRRCKIGSSLVRKAIMKMVDHGCEEVVLETEVTNKAALMLYENLGFVRDKRLLRYYLNGVDAWRLKLWLK